MAIDIHSLRSFYSPNILLIHNTIFLKNPHVGCLTALPVFSVNQRQCGGNRANNGQSTDGRFTLVESKLVPERSGLSPAGQGGVP